MLTRTLLLTALCASGLATAQTDGGPRRATADAGTRGTTVPDRTAPPPGTAGLPAPRTQMGDPVGTGSETPPPSRSTPPPTSLPPRELPPTSQPPRPTPH